MIFYDWLYIVLGLIILPGIIFGAYAQAKVSSTYSEARKIFAQKGVVSQNMARQVLDSAGLNNVQVVQIAGELTDNYNPKTKTISISSSNWNNASVASLGVVAHEIGHALQDAKNYKPLKAQMVLGKFSNFVGRAFLWIFIASIIFDVMFFYLEVYTSFYLVYFAFGLYGLSFLFSLLTLPVEFNASARTQEILLKTNLLTEEEFAQAKKVLNAAALTYVAAAVISFLQLLRFVLYFVIRTRKR